jgi:hypothetical protein
MKRTRIFTLAIAVMIVTACAPAATNIPPDDPAMVPPVGSDEPTPPQSGNFIPGPADKRLRHGSVYLDSTELLSMESYPPQFTLVLKGNMPNPCNHLRIAVKPPDAQNKIMASVYSVFDPNSMCMDVLQPFDVNYPLGSFPAGHYTLWLNGKQIAEFDA